MKAWHFCNGRRLRDGTPLEVGRTYTHEGPLEMGRRGYHASERIIDAIWYAPGAILCRVELGGEILRDTGKCVASRRTVLWAMDVERLLHYFVCDVATVALERRGWDADPRSWAAIDAKLGWLAGCVPDEDLDAARNAATATVASWAAAKYVAKDVAWFSESSAARDMAWAEADAHLLAMVEAQRKDGGELRCAGGEL